MSICIVAATSLELQHLTTSDKYNLLITGIGTAATVYHLTKKIHESKPSLIIQAGIAGSFGQQPLGTPLIVQQDRFADLGVLEQSQWKDLFDMGLQQPATRPYNNGWLVNPHDNLLNNLPWQKVSAITIHEITTNPERIRQYESKYQPAIESMEGAAFHYVCLQESIPFIQLRTTSNYIGERDKNKWQMQLAIRNLADGLQQIVNMFAK